MSIPAVQIDAEVAAFHELHRAQGFPDYVGVDAVRAREASRAVMRWRNMLASPVDAVRSIENTTIELGQRTLRARVYQPFGRAVAHVLYLHGGGFVMGDLDASDAHCRAIAALSGVIVTSLDYSLAPEHPFPRAAYESRDVVRQLCYEATTERGRDLPVAVAGDSAGANLAASALALLQQDERSAVKSQLLLYPMVDPSMSFPSIRDNGSGFMLERAAIKRFWGHYLDGRPEATVTTFLTGGLEGTAPAVVVTAGFDPLRDEGLDHARRLKLAGVPVTTLSFPSLVHGFFGWGAHVTAARTAVLEICLAFRQCLLA